MRMNSGRLFRVISRDEIFVTEIVKITQGESFRYENEDEQVLALILSEKLPHRSFQFNKAQRICKISPKYVGILELPTKIIEIFPRFETMGMKQVQMMYFFVNSIGVDALDYSEVFDLREGLINERIAKRFVRELANVMQKGLPHLYEEIKEDLDVIKGRIDLGKTYENIELQKSNPFHCEYSQTSLDNPVSRILGAALYKIETILPDDFVRFARYLPFCNVEEGKRLSDSYVISGREYNYSKALDWARLILYDLQVMSLGHGRFGSTFLIDLDRLFQDFCYKALKVFGKTNRLDVDLLVATPSIYYEEFDSPSREPRKIEPDVLYDLDEDSGIAEAVLDAKCKRVTLSPSDIYQIEFYSTCLFAKKCILMYPQRKKGTYHNIMKIRSELKSVHLKEIHAVYVDLTADTGKKFVSDTARFVKNLSDIILTD